MDVDLVLPGPRRPDHRPPHPDRRALRAAPRGAPTRSTGCSSERPRSAYEIAQALWGNIAVTQAYLTLSEVLGHTDLLANEGRVREVERDGRCRVRAGVASSAVSAETALERAEELAERLLPDRTPKRRMLVIVNPYATTVSDRLRNLVVYALQSRYAVEAIDTEKREHATQICREAAREGYDVVVAFGGDGTVNEAANGLARVRDAADRPAGRLHQRLGAHARDPQRRGRRHRAPAAHGRRLPPLPGGPGSRRRPPLRVRLGRRPRRLRGRARGPPPAAQGALRRLVLHLRRRRHLHPPLPGARRRACASAPTGGRSRASP